MSRVARIEMYHVGIPLPAPFRPAWIPGLPQTQNRFTLIRVVTQSGVEGWSAGIAMGREREGLGELVGPYLLGEDATDIDAVQQRLREMSYLGWRNWWIEPAFWDIRGKIEGKPVYELLGGKACDVRLYASTGELKGPAERIAEAEARLNEGFRVIKLRVHEHDPADDERQVTATAAALGDRMTIGVDANQGWRVAAVADAPLWDLDRAKRFADVCADHDISWLEEPLAMDGYDDICALRAYSRIPISGGELHGGGWPELQMMIQRGCYDIYQPDALFTGGIAQTMKVVRACEQAGVIYTPHTWTNGIGFAVNLQLMIASGFATKKPLEFPLAPPGWTVEARDGILTQPFRHVQGVMRAPTAPGLGFSIDPKALRRFGHRFFVMDKKRLAWFSLRSRGVKASLEVDRARRSRRSDGSGSSS